MTASDGSKTALLHPLYLDVSMLTGLLAQLAGPSPEGWAPPGLEEALGALDRWQPAEGAAVPPVSSSPAINYVATGLLQSLYGHLRSHGELQVVGDGAAVAGVAPGDLVEVRGTCIGNPFEDLVGFYGVLIPQILEQDALRGALLEQVREKQRGAQGPKGAPGARRPAAATAGAAATARTGDLARAAELLEEVSQGATEELAARLVLLLVEDVRRSPVRDVVIDAEDHAAVLTIATRMLAADTLAAMRGLEVRAVGMVAAVAGESGIDLTSRTLLGSLGGGVASDLVKSARTGPYEVEAVEPVVPPPALQLLPLAVLV
ncbi:MAG TPA: hypothetical protein VMD59_05980 [Acidimicrobiales bacterium]|nr:hypothetical protein [Acidimicrobiales bacterium]